MNPLIDLAKSFDIATPEKLTLDEFSRRFSIHSINLLIEQNFRELRSYQWLRMPLIWVEVSYTDLGLKSRLLTEISPDENSKIAIALTIIGPLQEWNEQIPLSVSGFQSLIQRNKPVVQQDLKEMAKIPENHLTIRNIYDAIAWLYGKEKSCTTLDLFNQNTESLDDHLRGTACLWMSNKASNVSEDPPDQLPYAWFEPCPTSDELINQIIDYKRIYRGTGTEIGLEPFLDSSQEVLLCLPVAAETFQSALETVTNQINKTQ